MNIDNDLRSGKTIRTLRFEHETVDFGSVADPELIERLEIAFCNLTNLSGIERFCGLRQLSIYYCRMLHDISHIGDLHTLEDIVLYSLPKTEIHFCCESLPKLTGLSYTAVSGLSTLRGVEKLHKLRCLTLSKVDVADGDYSPIVESQSLMRVFWVGSPFKSPALKELRKLRPDIVIGGNAYNEVYKEKLQKLNNDV